MTDRDVVERVYWERVCWDRRHFLTIAVERGHVREVEHLYGRLVGDLDCAVLAGASVDTDLAPLPELLDAARQRQGSCLCPLCRVGRS